MEFIRRSLRSVLDNKLPLQQAIVIPKISSVIEPDLKELMLLESTYGSIADLLQLLEPVQTLIAVAEADSCNAASMLGSYYAFEDRIRESAVEWKNELLGILEKRLTMLYHPLLALACIFNPADQGRSINRKVDNIDGEVDRVLEILIPDEDDRTVVFAQLMQYRTRTGLFESRSLWSVADSTIVAPTTWWRSFSRASELSALAIRVLEIPLSSASIERVWWTFGFVHINVPIG